MPNYILTNQSGAGLSFVANNAVKSLAVAQGNLPLEDDVPNRSFIQEGDNIYIHEVGFFIPYQYSRGALGQAELTLQYQNRSATAAGDLPAFGSNGGTMIIPEYNQWITVNAFQPYPTAAGEDWRILASLNNADVSQLNAPGSLNGDTIECKIMVRLTSNLNPVL